MLEEIREQPSALERTLGSELPSIEKLKAHLEHRRPKLVVLAARGTSDNAALFGKYLIEITTGIPVALSAPSIFTLYGGSVDFREALVVAISQSGESTDINLVLERAKQGGAITVGITNESDSTLAKLADFPFLVRAGKEKSVAATKTYTGQLLMLYGLAYALRSPICISDLQRIPASVAAALTLEAEIASRCERYTYMRRTLSVARGLNYPNAFEFSLKLMETCYVVAERFSAADLLHGPIAMIEPSFPTFLFAPAGVTWPGIRDLVGKLHELEAESTVITDRSNSEALSLAQRAICIPADLRHEGSLPAEVYTPIPYIVPAQLFAASLAEHKGLDPDAPRALSKVTQTL